MLRLEKKDSDLQTYFSSFFNKVIYALSSKHLNSSQIRAISKQESQVVEKALELNLSRNRIPFLPVLPHSYVSIEDQLNLIIDPRGNSSTQLNIDEIEDSTMDLNKPYFIFGVEDGRETQGIPCNDMREIFARDNQIHPLTTSEVISVAMFNGSLEKRNLLAMGSTYKNGKGEEFILLKTNSEGDVKTLVSAPPAHLYYEYTGTPSCCHREQFS